VKLVINACNIHNGGGKTILTDFLTSSVDFPEITFHVFIDPRFDQSLFNSENIIFEIVSLSQRFSVFSKIEKMVDQDDLILYFGNLPPMSPHKAKVLLLQSNRFLVDNFPLTGLTLKTKIRILIERFMLRKGIRNVDLLIVQSETMADCVKKFIKNSTTPIVKVWPFKNIDVYEQVDKDNDEVSFLYVANLEPYKNHKVLLSAWKLLKDEGIIPKLYLTIDGHTFPKEYENILEYIANNNLNISIKPDLNRSDLLAYFSKVDCLIYPSLFESYGLPIVEAMNMNIPIIASELDFVRDLVDPDESFDPKSPKSTFRAVCRFLNKNTTETKVYTGQSFIQEILKMR